MKAVKVETLDNLPLSQNEENEGPDGWAFPKVGDILEINYGKGLIGAKRKAGLIPVYGSNGVVGYHDEPLTDGQTIILGRKGTVGAVHFSTGPCWPIDTTYFIHNFHGLRAKYVFYALGSLGLASLDKSSAIPGINRDDIYSQIISIPPFVEQDRIVCKVDELLAGVDSAREHLARVPGILKQFRQSVLAAACSGRLTADWREDAAPKDLISPQPANPDEICEVEETVEAAEPWRWLPLQALCDPDRSICYGVIKLGVEVPDGIPCLRTSDVKPLLIDTMDVKRIAPAISDEYRRTLLCGSEILVNVRGTLGGVAVVPDSLRGWNISREVALVPVKSVIPKFIAFWIASLPCQNWLTGVAKGVAYTGINIADLKLLPVAFPSLPEQLEIVRRVEGLFALADEIEARLGAAQRQVDALTPSLLARAFAGQLVPQDPNDEPANVLLERLKSERGAAGQRKGRRRED